ncbi:MAG TPA: quinoprotein dehydrogenase-associated putative ABC transporter substrate-binding protein [Candidatus Acidoferrales bacterium]|nr:quinoprotein dehydrogenase-associated putative ABC transporter substrate-binding protein [Candidatus Acidoferrales bacterium]
MFSAFKTFAALLLCAAGASASPAQLLKVCADPNNLPYSNKQGQGFENKLAALVAKDFGLQISYFWFPQHDAFFRRTLNAGECDVVMGVPAGIDEADATEPYYRSSYVFVSRRDLKLKINSFDDPRLKTLRVGVNVLGDGEDSLPPVYALASRGIVRNVVGYSVFGAGLAQTDRAADLIHAVSENDVDVAIAWGPVAGYYARRSSVPLELTPVENDPAHPEMPLTFEIGIGVRQGNVALKQRLEAELKRRHSEILQLLRGYGIPQLNLAAPSSSLAEN